MLEILEKLLNYIKEKNPSFKAPKRGNPFICPICAHPDGTAIILPEIHSIMCQNPKCKSEGGLVGNIIDLVKHFEPEKSHFSKDEIISYLAEKYNIKYTSQNTTDIILDYYEKNNFDLVPVGSNQKIPIEKGWPTKEHKNKNEWNNWLKDNLNIGCYDEQTEILTDQGWKLFKDLDKTEKVATLNPNTKELEYQTPSRYISYNYEGMMYKLKSSTLDLVVTPNHNLFYRKYKRDHFLQEVQHIKQLNCHKQKPIGIPITAKWNPKNNIGAKYIISASTNITKFSPLEFVLKDWVEFLGWYIAEGHFVENSPKVYWRIVISQYKNQEKRQKIKKLLNRMGLSFIETHQGYILSNKILWHYLKQLGRCKDKFIPSDIKQLNSEYLSILYETLIDGDGWRQGNTESYCSISKQLVDDVSELMLKLGFSFVIYKRPCKYNGIIKKIPKNKHDLYIVSKKLKSYRTIGKDNVTQIPYNNTVYCVEVPNSIIYVKRNGKVCWCGNCKTGKASNITVIDIDQHPIPYEILSLLGEQTTMYQRTAHGCHYFFKYEADLPKTRIVDLKIDIENDGGQVIIPPSKIDGKERKIELYEIQTMPSELKKFLLEQTANKNHLTPIPPARKDDKEINLTDIKFNGAIAEGNRHHNFMKFGGLLHKKMNLNDVSYTLSMINKYLCKPPLSYLEIQGILSSIDRYVTFDEKELSFKILDYIEKIEEGTSRDVREALGYKKEQIDTALAFLVKKGYLIRKRRFFKAIKKMQWREEFMDDGKPINFKMPYFDDIATLRQGDLVIIGAKTGVGKSCIAVNMMKRLVEQNIKPKYVNLESANRFLSVAKSVGLKEGDFDWVVNFSPETMELDDNAFTIIDWLLPNDYAETDKIYKYFAEQLGRHKGILVVFVQLKATGEFFAPNQIEMFPSLAAKFSYEDETGERGSFQITKVREAKTQYRFKKINTIYDWKSKELLTLDEYELKNKGTKTKLKTDLDMEKIDANNNFSVDDISNNIF